MPTRARHPKNFHDDDDLKKVLPHCLLPGSAIEDGIATLACFYGVLDWEDKQLFIWRVKFNFDPPLCFYDIKHFRYINWWLGFDERSLEEIAQSEGVL